MRPQLIQFNSSSSTSSNTPSLTDTSSNTTISAQYIDRPQLQSMSVDTKIKQQSSSNIITTPHQFVLTPSVNSSHFTISDQHQQHQHHPIHLAQSTTSIHDSLNMVQFVNVPTNMMQLPSTQSLPIQPTFIGVPSGGLQNVKLVQMTTAPNIQRTVQSVQSVQSVPAPPIIYQIVDPPQMQPPSNNVINILNPSTLQNNIHLNITNNHNHNIHHQQQRPPQRPQRPQNQQNEINQIILDLVHHQSISNSHNSSNYHLSATAPATTNGPRCHQYPQQHNNGNPLSIKQQKMEMNMNDHKNHPFTVPHTTTQPPMATNKSRNIPTITFSDQSLGLSPPNTSTAASPSVSAAAAAEEEHANEVLKTMDKPKRGRKKIDRTSFLNTQGRYQCSLCDRSYKRFNDLKGHWNVHEAKTKGCPYCGKKFSRPVYLNDHVRSHTGEKPFQCSICLKKFGAKRNLTQHKKIHLKNADHTAFMVRKLTVDNDYQSKQTKHVKLASYAQKNEMQ